MKNTIEKKSNRKSNRKFSETDTFIKVCKEYNINPTNRQAGKYRNKRGILYNKIYKSEGLNGI